MTNKTASEEARNRFVQMVPTIAKNPLLETGVCTVKYLSEGDEGSTLVAYVCLTGAKRGSNNMPYAYVLVQPFDDPATGARLYQVTTVGMQSGFDLFARSDDFFNKLLGNFPETKKTLTLIPESELDATIVEIWNNWFEEHPIKRYKPASF